MSLFRVNQMGQGSRRADAIVANSEAITAGMLVRKSGGFIGKAGAGDALEGMTDATITVASNNQTVGKIRIGYEIGRDGTTFLLPASGETIVFAGDLITSNTINMTVNGVAMTQVTFSSNHATTMGLIATQLATQFASVIDTVTVGGASSRTLFIKPKGDNSTVVVASIVVGAGTSQTTGTFAATSLAQTDEGKSFNIITSTQYVDISTGNAYPDYVDATSSSTTEPVVPRQVRLEQFVDNLHSVYSIVRIH